MQAVAHYLIKGGRELCNLFFPPQCMACYKPIATHGALCAPCWNQVEYITAPQCAVCGTPFDYKVEGRHVCGKCIQSPPPYTMARTVCRYNATSSKLVTGLKYADKTYLAPYLGKWLVQAGREFLAEADIIAPVPLHRYRLFTRRYNQSAMLAREVAKASSNLRLMLPLLTRQRNTPPQAGLSQKQRHTNVKGAFEVNPRYKEYIRNKHIVLVDDVMTTGATVSACAAILLKHGARRVDVLALGQTLNT